ncbi:MAG: YdcF family protein [Clostridia bacterium]|nr:YdcF family protein [Clostridia bacterium]
MFKKRKWFKILLALSLIIALMGVYAISVNIFVKHSQKSNVMSAEKLTKQYDAIIILGCGVKPDGTPTDMLLDRLITGVSLYKQGVAPVIIMSGDHGRKNYDEVNAMKDYAVKEGVPAEKVFLDHAGFNTYESMYRADAIFGVKSAVIVTQEYHLYRALYNAGSFGIEAVGVSATLHRYHGQLTRDLREIVARNKDFIWCIFKPEPTYLGDPIDLKGDSIQTNG